MNSTQCARPAFDEIDLSSRAFWAGTAAERERTFATLRVHRPVSWHRPVENPSLAQGPVEPGFWAIVRHADLVEVSRANDIFLSSKGVLFEPVPEHLIEATASFLGMDGARHAQIRGLVRSAFTPRNIARLITSCLLYTSPSPRDRS